MAKAKKTESAAKPAPNKAVAKKAPAKKPTAAGSGPMVDTTLAAQNAAKHLAAGIPHKAAASWWRFGRQKRKRNVQEPQAEHLQAAPLRPGWNPRQVRLDRLEALESPLRRRQAGRPQPDLRRRRHPQRCSPPHAGMIAARHARVSRLPSPTLRRRTIGNGLCGSESTRHRRRMRFGYHPPAADDRRGSQRNLRLHIWGLHIVDLLIVAGFLVTILIVGVRGLARRQTRGRLLSRRAQARTRPPVLP